MVFVDLLVVSESLGLIFISLNQKKDRPSGNRPVRDTVSEDAATTIYVSGLKDSTTTDAITYFFENKKRTGGGDLCEGKEGFKKLSPTVARLTFVSSKGIVYPQLQISLEIDLSPNCYNQKVAHCRFALSVTQNSFDYSMSILLMISDLI